MPACRGYNSSANKLNFSQSGLMHKLVISRDLQLTVCETRCFWGDSWVYALAVVVTVCVKSLNFIFNANVHCWHWLCAPKIYADDINGAEITADPWMRWLWNALLTQYIPLLTYMRLWECFCPKNSEFLLLRHSIYNWRNSRQDPPWSMAPLLSVSFTQMELWELTFCMYSVSGTVLYMWHTNVELTERCCMSVMVFCHQNYDSWTVNDSGLWVYSRIWYLLLSYHCIHIN